MIDIQGGVTADGTPLIDWPTDGGEDNQLWQFVPDPKGSGFSLIQSRLNGNVIDIQGASTANGTALIDWPPDGGDNQLWNLVLFTPPVVSGPFSIKAENFPNNRGEGTLGTPFTGLSFAVANSGQIPAQGESPPGTYQVVVSKGTTLTLGPTWLAAGYSIVTATGLPTNGLITNSPANIFVQGPNVL